MEIFDWNYKFCLSHLEFVCKLDRFGVEERDAKTWKVLELAAETGNYPRE